MDLTVSTTEPALRGVASASMKPATLETGLVVQVPQFVKDGDVVRLDTTDGGTSTSRHAPRASNLRADQRICTSTSVFFPPPWARTALLEDSLPYLLPNTRTTVDVFDGNVIGVTLPTTVDLTVSTTEPSPAP